MKRWLRSIAKLMVAIAVIGGIVLVSGIIPIKASSGHWAITTWFLDFAKNRSVATHSIGIQRPDLDDPGLILRGAGHFQLGCMPCHGSPELKQPVIPHQMTPHPPYLPPAVVQWEPEELFYIVKHGIKFTGMPAWPARDRDDEVWAVVAFMMRLPEMTPEQYSEWVFGPASADEPVVAVEDLAGAPDFPPGLVESCAVCHGSAEGAPRSDEVPLLAGQRPTYLAATMRAFLAGRRHSGIMQPVASGLSAEEIIQLADYYGSADASVLSQTAEPEVRDAESVARGAAIARLGVPADRVPACIDCHGEAEDRRGSGVTSAKNPHYPILAGQNAEYLELQLYLFQRRARGGTEYAHLMHHVADHLSADQIRDVAVYFASLGDASTASRD